MADLPAPGGFGSPEKQERFPCRLPEVRGELHRVDLPVAGLDPFMAENHIRRPVRGYMECPVQALPFRRRHRPVRPWLKGTHGRSCPQDGRAPAPRFAFEAGEHIVHSLPRVHLRRPVVPVRPEGSVVPEAGEGPFPVFKVLSPVNVKAVRRSPAGRAAGPVKVVGPAAGKHKRIPDIDLVCPDHGLLPFLLRLRRHGVRPVVPFVPGSPSVPVLQRRFAGHLFEAADEGSRVIVA